MNLPPVEWDPKKPAEQLERFEAAFDRLWDFSECQSEDDVRRLARRPGECSENVIDIVNQGRGVGIRIICSRELQPGGEFCHVSASLHHTDCLGRELFEELQKMWRGLRLERLGKPVRDLLTDRGISHWFFETPEWVKSRVAEKGGVGR